MSASVPDRERSRMMENFSGRTALEEELQSRVAALEAEVEKLKKHAQLRTQHGAGQAAPVSSDRVEPKPFCTLIEWRPTSGVYGSSPPTNVPVLVLEKVHRTDSGDSTFRVSVGVLTESESWKVGAFAYLPVEYWAPLPSF